MRREIRGNAWYFGLSDGNEYGGTTVDESCVESGNGGL